MSKVMSKSTVVCPRKAEAAQYSDGPLGSFHVYDLKLALEWTVNESSDFNELTQSTFPGRGARVIEIAQSTSGRHDILDELANRGELSAEDVNHAALADEASPFDLRFVVFLAIADFQQDVRDRRTGYLVFMAESNALGITN